MLSYKSLHSFAVSFQFPYKLIFPVSGTSFVLYVLSCSLWCSKYLIHFSYIVNTDNPANKSLSTLTWRVCVRLCVCVWSIAKEVGVFAHWGCRQLRHSRTCNTNSLKISNNCLKAKDRKCSIYVFFWSLVLLALCFPCLLNPCFVYLLSFHLSCSPPSCLSCLRYSLFPLLMPYLPLSPLTFSVLTF